MAAAQQVRSGFAAAQLGIAVLAPALLVAWMSFDHGGNRPGTAGLGAALLAAVLAARLALAPETVRRPRAFAAVAVVALAAFCVWIAASMLWSNAEDRAVSDFCRAALYLTLLGNVVTLPREALPWVARSLAVVLLGIGLIALLSRTWPELEPTRPSVADGRLNFPLGYWNALGLMLATGLLLLVHLACDAEEHAAVRVVATAALPLMVPALYLTQSRGGLGVALVAGLAYIGLARPRGLPSAAAAAVLPVLVSLGYAYHLTGPLLDPSWREAPGEGAGHRLLAVAIAGAIVAAYLRYRFRGLDGRPRLAPVPRIRPQALAAIAVALLIVLGAAAVAADAPARFQQAFKGPGPGSSTWTDPRSRLTAVYSNGRSELWSAALQDLGQHPVTGTGAGTFSSTWARERTDQSEAVDAHSLYVETLGELGLIGLGLVVVFIGALALAVWMPSGRLKASHAVAMAVLVAWALQAGVEWVWEIPAATIAAIGLAGAAGAGDALIHRRLARVPLVAACFALAAVPAAEAYTQRRLANATVAYNADDCARALREGRVVADITPWRPEPHVVAALCAARRDDRGTAISQLAAAERRSPDDWQLEVDRAIIDGATGADPARSLMRAKNLNPRDGVILYLWSARVTRPRDQWRALFGAAFPYIGGFVELPPGRGAICSGYSAGYFRWTTWVQDRCRPTTGVAHWRGPTKRPLTGGLDPPPG